jgi:hypothetical protein
VKWSSLNAIASAVPYCVTLLADQLATAREMIRRIQHKQLFALRSVVTRTGAADRQSLAPSSDLCVARETARLTYYSPQVEMCLTRSSFR